jgi:hypothetical protein
MTEAVITRTFVRALKEKHSAIAAAERSRPFIPFVKFKVMEEVSLAVVKGFSLREEPELSELIVVMHSSMLEAVNAELMNGFKSVTKNTDGSITPNTPEHRPIYPDNVIMTFLTALRLTEKLTKQGRYSEELKNILETKDSLSFLVDGLAVGKILPTPSIIISGTDVLWKLSSPYMFQTLGEENHTIFTVRYSQAAEFFAEIECTERRS